MNEKNPLVSIGIPTYNRSVLLKRSIESALAQDYQNVEIIISDNASTDNTRSICQLYCAQDARVKYFQQPCNLGPTANFTEVFKIASGEYFLWLGDDDWIDVSYVSYCVTMLNADQNMALVSGAPLYYRDGKKEGEGKLFDLPEENWAIRVARYYTNVTDNGMFYGVMRTAQLQQVTIPNTIGGDWHLIANIASLGKVKMCSAVSVHRERGGATVSYQKIVKTMGLPKIQAIFPISTIALGAAKNIIFAGAVYKKHNILARTILAGVVILRVIKRPIMGYTARAKNLIKSGFRLVFNYANSK